MVDGLRLISATAYEPRAPRPGRTRAETAPFVVVNVVAAVVIAMARSAEALLAAAMLFAIVWAAWRRRGSTRAAPRFELRGAAAVGADGIDLGHGDFVPVAAVTDARIQGEWLVVERGISPPLYLAIELAEERRAAFARVRGDGGSTTADPAATKLLARGEGEQEDAWRARLRTLADEDEGYRAAGVSIERARVVLEDVSSDPSARVGATELLRGRLSHAERRAIAVALEETAHPRVRVALSRLVDEDDADQGSSRSQRIDAS